MELNLGSRAIFQLQEIFLFLNSEFDCEGFLPVVNISVEIAKELHQLYIESANLQMENQKHLLRMLNSQDELYAKQLALEDRKSEFSFLKTSNLNFVLKDRKVKLQRNETNSYINCKSKETVELIIDAQAVSQLEAQFGDYGSFPQGFQPVIQVSLKLAEELHSAYMQSVLLQKRNEEQILAEMAKQQRRAAKKIRKKENQQSKISTKTKASDHQKDKKKTNNVVETSFKQDTTNLLVVQKLTTAYPSVPKELILELLMAFEYSHEEVFNALKASSVKIIGGPDQNTTDKGVNEARSGNKTAEKCRQEAQMYFEKQQELNSKARQANQQKNFYVAQHLGETAQAYRTLYEEATEMAVTLIMEEEDVKHSNTLDLHYFNVKEALQSLNLYINDKINLLKKSKQKMEKLSIITGRGKHSANGKSKLRPAVQDLLRRRNILFIQPGSNAGSIKVDKRALALLKEGDIFPITSKCKLFICNLVKC